MAKIFLSYARSDLPMAQRLYRELASRTAHSIWMDNVSLLPGARWEPAIRKAIRESRYFVGLFSTKSVSSRGYRHSELRQAMQVLDEYPPEQIYMVPVRLEECTLPDERLRELNYVDLFPRWGEGLKRLCLALNGAQSEGPQIRTNTTYQYRVALLDIDAGVRNLSRLSQALNERQSLFVFSTPKKPPVNRTTTRIDGRSYFSINKVPDSFYHEARYLAVDLIAMFTRLPLAFTEGAQQDYNHFAQSGGPGGRFLFLSTDRLKDYAALAERTFEEGLVYVLTGQLINFFAETGYHDETKACLMDRCESRAEIAYGMNELGLCRSCLKAIKMPGLLEAVTGLLGAGPKKP